MYRLNCPISSSPDDAGVHGGHCRGSVSSCDEEEQPSPGAPEGRIREDDGSPQLHQHHAAGAVRGRHHQQDKVWSAACVLAKVLVILRSVENKSTTVTSRRTCLVLSYCSWCGISRWQIHFFLHTSVMCLHDKLVFFHAPVLITVKLQKFKYMFSFLIFLAP